MDNTFSIRLSLEDGYEFSIDFEKEGVAPLLTDESPPLGSDAGPSPAQLLAAAVGNCMAASLKFCLERARVGLEGLEVAVTGTMVRNERGRLRVGSLKVDIVPTVERDDLERVDRCLGVFEDFCIVGQSVREGVDLEVSVRPEPSEQLA